VRSRRSAGAGGASTARLGSLARTVAVMLLAPAAAYAALWLGGAVEVLAHDARPSGPACSERLSVSTVAEGREQPRWFGGGIGWRPGTVCVIPPFDADPPIDSIVWASADDELLSTGEAYRRMTVYDVVSALFAALLFIVVAILGDDLLEARRSRPDLTFPAT
jgi:hypothetical protein